MKQKRILFTGGGTAGHVIVNLALIPYFQKEGWKIDYIGSKQGIERDLIKEIPNITYYPISTGKLRRYFSLENLKDPFKVLKGTIDAWNVIRKTKPNVIFSKGGFVSVPVVVAARFRRVPTIIHESDLTPGLANKLATPFAKKVLTTFPETVKYLPEKKTVYVGAVIREELFQGNKSRGYQLTNLTSEKPIILIMGGSIGSRKINEIVRENLDAFLQKYQIIHICGRNNVDSSFEQKGYVQFEYINEDLKNLFAITDFVISRAGANAIFEFLALDLPMLLIPLSLAASRGDQIDNAKSFQKNGFAHVLPEEELTTDRFLQEVIKLEKAVPVIKDKMKQYSSEESRRQVIHFIEEMAK
ncbi:MAG TPA: undecaprenyldiphospho-muramoylpentapeptide beta-N-acetylglucosaminyltransferase [Pseudogracilibacillus sp.]|nr:undecaprenyldiphospho-muramoylpentapeptide beta-N-acetylglucosaminyltransferase [Pseudogracilibacillus sp.]